MTQNFAPQRRRLLALQNEAPPPATGLIVPPRVDRAGEPGRQTALSIPEEVRALGEPLGPFFEACGGRQSLSLSVGWTGSRSSPETYIFRQPFVLIGRCRESDLALPDREVKFRHLYLQLVAGRWMFVDLGRLGGRASAKGGKSSGWFDCADELSAGPYTITHLGSHSSELSCTGALAPPPPALPAVDLQFISSRSNGGAVQSWRVPGAVTLVGASRQCDLWLDDESVSNVHASLVLTGRGLWAVDLLGRGGVSVDDRPIYWKQLHDGSVLQIGRYRFRARFDGTRDQALHRVEEPPAGTLSIPEQGVSVGSGLSDQTVMALIRHMSEMQNRFFEHSQQQSKLMAEMLAQLGRGAQASVREDMARIEDITRELEELKSQIAALPAASAAGSLPNDSAAPVVVVPPGIRGEAGRGNDLPPPSNVAHSRLTQRMAQLAESRNSAWRRVLDAFSRKPDRPAD
jgi:pSer/pThr/pTyr-binding forkhead associated (FHA) protein